MVTYYAAMGKYRLEQFDGGSRPVILLAGKEYGVTILQGEGGYTGDEKRVLLVAFKQREIVDIKRQVHELDEGAFLIVCDARDVLGEGFGEYRQDEI